MILSIKLLNLVGLLFMATYLPGGSAESEEVDEENSLKQAIFLVELLKSDFAKILRENSNYTNDANANFTEDANTTCALRSDDFNSTIAINESGLTESAAAVSSASEASTTSLPNPTPPRMPPVLQFSSWPPLPMPGYMPPLGPPRQGNFQDEYRFPYRFSRRRMMPDYYYYDPPVQRRGNFRRQNNPNDDQGIDTATTQAQTTIYIPSTTSEATTLHVEETTATLATFSTIKQLSTSNLPTTQPSSVSTIELSTLPVDEPTSLSTVEPSTLSTVEASTLSTTLSIVASSTLSTTEAATLSTIETSTSSTSEATTQPSTESLTLLTKPRNRIGVRTPFEEAKTTGISNRNEKRVTNTDGRLLRQQNSTTEKSPEDIEMSQVASELAKELKGAKNGSPKYFYDYAPKNRSAHKKHRTSKVYLKGSSRLPVPLPENNAFCHAYPHNALCGTML